MDEGYIKFNCNWIKAAPCPKQQIENINAWRDRLYQLGLIGAYPNGIGFGNISIRSDGQTFVITGSATGNFKRLDEFHYVLVTEYDLMQNSLTCSGPIKASSESLSHAVIYESSSETKAVIHIHSMEKWKKYIHKFPTTKTDVLYGTPEMANEIERLFRETDVPEKKIIIMGGHEEGIITFGKTLDEAGKLLLDLL
ncbi:class II aldolase/adducin family protein [Saccharicrinis sp. FJH2]|uniref:class II aldolase/adducin family protein n=1 Tax=Saccharicrinis sp. FJH65 TaxID=3344659 RepID=UPI0035F4DBC4